MHKRQSSSLLQVLLGLLCACSPNSSTAVHRLPGQNSDTTDATPQNNSQNKSDNSTPLSGSPSGSSSSSPPPATAAPKPSLEGVVLSDATVSFHGSGLLVKNVSRMVVSDVSTGGHTRHVYESRPREKPRLTGSYNGYDNDTSIVGSVDRVEPDSAFFDLSGFRDGTYLVTVKTSEDRAPHAHGQWFWVENADTVFTRTNSGDPKVTFSIQQGIPKTVGSESSSRQGSPPQVVHPPGGTPSGTSSGGGSSGTAGTQGGGTPNTGGIVGVAGLYETLLEVVIIDRPLHTPLDPPEHVSLESFRAVEHPADLIVSSVKTHVALPSRIQYVETKYGVMVSVGSGQIVRIGSGLWNAYLERAWKSREHMGEKWNEFVPISGEEDDGAHTTYLDLIDEKTGSRARIHHRKDGSGTFGYTGRLWRLSTLFQRDLGSIVSMQERSTEQGKITFSNGSIDLDLVSNWLELKTGSLMYQEKSGQVQAAVINFVPIVTGGVTLAKALSDFVLRYAPFVMGSADDVKPAIDYGMLRLQVVVVRAGELSNSVGKVAHSVKPLLERLSTERGRRIIELGVTAAMSSFDLLVEAYAGGPLITEEDYSKYKVDEDTFTKRMQEAERALRKERIFGNFGGFHYDPSYSGRAHYDYLRLRVVYGPLDRGNVFMLAHEATHYLDHVAPGNTIEGNNVTDHLAHTMYYGEMEGRTAESMLYRMNGGPDGEILQGIFGDTRSLSMTHLRTYMERGLKMGLIERIKKRSYLQGSRKGKIW